ncbi:MULTISPECIES: 2Fe-2S iron-sulfur cluster-binding protein [Prochlorococcus]|uniref:2Fe-2S iron-sulfur cluster-binding protein n=1 Tax=Prochlorococcus TaxID=1218 RepID=UPI00053390BA|nr:MULTISPECIES: 2Fe-2S iron-sulfur cluster-binding protein [Prochlorococcus]KGG12111.1 Ferredoxin [Prochlorococcus sp. MIT 0601]
MIQINWPNGKTSIAKEGTNWLEEACKAGFDIPTGCLKGSCGACEIEVEGKTLRACIHSIPKTNSSKLNVALFSDPYW